jgi:hypothetical protein
MLSSGAARDGLAALDKLGWVHEGQGNYLKDAAAAYFQSTDDGKSLDRCLAVSPTWEENRHLTQEIYNMSMRELQSITLGWRIHLINSPLARR